MSPRQNCVVYEPTSYRTRDERLVPQPLYQQYFKKNYISSQNKIILILFLLYVSQTFKFLNNKTDYNNHIPRHCHGMGSYTRIYSSSTKWDVIPLLPKDALFPTHFHLSPKFVYMMPQRIYSKTYMYSINTL